MKHSRLLFNAAYWVSAISGSFCIALVLLRVEWLPFWAVWLVSCFVGIGFGLAMGIGILNVFPPYAGNEERSGSGSLIEDYFVPCFPLSFMVSTMARLLTVPPGVLKVPPGCPISPWGWGS